MQLYHCNDSRIPRAREIACGRLALFIIIHSLLFGTAVALAVSALSNWWSSALRKALDRFQWRIVTICHNNAPAEFNQTNFHKGFLLQSCQQIMFCSRTQPHRDKIYCATHHEVQCLELEASWKVCALNILRRSRSKWWRSKPTELEQKLPKAKQHTISLMWVASETVCIGSPAASWPAGEAPADKTSKSTPKKINSWLSRGVKLAFDYTCRSCVGLQNWS